MDFAYRIAVVGNTFDVLGGPITNKTRNDGETLLTEGGAGSRTENLGTVATATLSTLTDPDNTITNTQGEWASYVTLRFVRTDATDFGLGTVGIEVRGNTITANHPNISLPHEEVADREGYTNRMHAEGPTQAVAKNQTRLLGTIFQNNQCNRCKTPLLIRDGAKATVLDSNLSTLAIE